MATYIPNATQIAEPTEDRTVESAALEFRTLKSSVNARIDAVQDNVDAEAATRGADDLTEAGLRTAADGVLQAQINAAAVVQANQRLQYLRVPESSVDALPEAGTRAGKVLGFDASGKPIPVAVSGASDPSLRADLAQPTGDTLVGSEDGAGGSLWTTVAGFIARTRSSAGASLVGFVQSGIGAAIRTLEEKLREGKSLFDFSGANADEQFANAKANGTAWIRIPQGTHTISGWEILENDSLMGLIFEPGARLLVTAAQNRIGLDIQKNWFKIRGDCWIGSTGTATDTLQTIGVRQGHPINGGKAFFEADSIRYAGFSGRGFVSYQPVYIAVGSVVGTGSGNSPMYGVSVERANIPNIGLIPGTTVQIGRCYISGARRGINLDGVGWVELDMPVLEYCGSSTSEDGALHMLDTGRCVIKNIYGEQNARNIVRIDSTPVFIGGAMFAATAPDVARYVGTEFDQRGTVQIKDNTISARRIVHDLNDNENLTIGTNIVVPAAGGSAIFGRETMQEFSGTLTSGAWTTVFTIPTGEMAGSGQARAMYEYVCYAGISDLTTGFDAGTLINGVLRSYQGDLPAWLRISGDDLQMNVTSGAYGLYFKIVLRKMLPT